MLCGGRGRPCGGSVNAGAEVQTQTGRVRKSSRAMGARRGRLSAPWLQFHGVGRADVYIIIRVRASRCGESALNPPTSPPIPRRRPAPAPAQRRALPAHFRSPLTTTMHARRPHNPFPAEDLLPPPHSDTPFPSTSAPTQRRCIPLTAPMHARRPHDTFPVEDLLPPPHSDTPSPNTSAPPRSADARPQAARCIPRRPHNPFPPLRHAASPSVPLRAQKNGTAQWMCDAECLGRPSLRSVIGVGEPRAVRRRCGALAWRVGLRPQPWALRSRRCGRVLRA